MTTKQKFIELSTPRTGVLLNGGTDFTPTKYIRKKHLSKEKTILRKTYLRLLMSPKFV